MAKLAKEWQKQADFWRNECQFGGWLGWFRVNFGEGTAAAKIAKIMIVSEDLKTDPH